MSRYRNRTKRTQGSRRQTLKHHLEAQWLRGQGNPKERAPKRKRYNRAPRGDLKENPKPGTRLGEVWPDA